MSFSLYPEFVDITQTNIQRLWSTVNKIAYSKPLARHIPTKYHIVGTRKGWNTHSFSWSGILSSSSSSCSLSLSCTWHYHHNHQYSGFYLGFIIWGRGPEWPKATSFLGGSGGMLLRKFFEMNMRWDTIWCILRPNFEKCYNGILFYF